MQISNNIGYIRAGLCVLFLLQTIMLAALFTRTPPHPPLEVAPFAIAPFLAASASLAAAACLLLASNIVAGLACSVLAALTGLVSYGPQKWFDAAFPKIWPAVGLAEIAIVLIFFAVLREIIRLKHQKG